MSGLDVQTEGDIEADAVVLGRGAAGCVAAIEAGAHTLDALGNGSYYICTSAPGVARSARGPRCDEYCRVLDPFGATIAGLCAAGSFSPTGSRHKDGGLHIAEALAFGRIVDRTAAAATTGGSS